MPIVSNNYLPEVIFNFEAWPLVSKKSTPFCPLFPFFNDTGYFFVFFPRNAVNS
jgi:hypothetical protein